MKKQLFKTGMFLSLAALAFGCSTEEEDLLSSGGSGVAAKSAMVAGPEKITFDAYNTGSNGFLTYVMSDKASGPIMVSAMRRTMPNTYGTNNVANIFNSGQPSSIGNQVTDILTPHQNYGGGGIGDGGAAGAFVNNTALGKMMIINRTDAAGEAYDYNSGGKMMIDFSALGTVTMNSVTVMDIDDYEAGSKVVLYGPSSNVLKEVMMQVSGNNGKQIVNLGGTKGVARMEIVLGPEGISPNGGLSGSGAIDDIEFMREGMMMGCTYTQGYWKNHATGKKADLTWGDLPGKIFYGSGMTYLNLMNTAPKGGNAYVQLAHQFIAATLNVKKGASTTPQVGAALAAALAYFSAVPQGGGAYLNTINSPYITATKNQLTQWADVLAAYNEGKIGPGHCD